MTRTVFLVYYTILYLNGSVSNYSGFYVRLQGFGAWENCRKPCRDIPEKYDHNSNMIVNRAPSQYQMNSPLQGSGQQCPRKLARLEQLHVLPGSRRVRRQGCFEAQNSGPQLDLQCLEIVVLSVAAFNSGRAMRCARCTC